MHQSSYETMAELRKKYVAAGSRVLDFGGANINGTYRDLFQDCHYESLDFSDADIIVTGYDWPLADASYDVVISGQCLEHDKFFWVTMKNMARVVRSGGHVIIIVPSAGHEHRYPVDCYRFYPDAMSALAEWAGLELLEAGRNAAEPWRDTSGVMRKP